MDLVSLENDKFKVSLKAFGAEFATIFSKEYNIEYLWQGDPDIWAGQSPLLFPFIGRLVDGVYRYAGSEYRMPKHGFARHSEFEVLSRSETSVAFKLCQSPKTISVYPFKFDLRVRYDLLEDGVKVSYSVSNTGQKEMYFSIGAHPGFDLNSIFGDCRSKGGVYVEFDRPQHLDRWYVGNEGVDGFDKNYLDGESVIEIDGELFKDDALIFKSPTAKAVKLGCKGCGRAVKMEFEGFTHFGLWGKPGDTPFVCLEPWFGLDDNIDFRGPLNQKEGIINLGPEKIFSSDFVIKFL